MIRAAIEDARASGALIQLERGFASARFVNGYVVALGDELVAVHQFHDFYDEGWVVVRIDDVLEVNRDGPQRHFEACFRGEGLAPRPLPCAVDLASMQAALRSLRPRGALMFVECEAPDADDDATFLGRLVDVTDLHGTVRQLDALGQWDPPVAVALGRITRLQLDTPFCRTFAKYAAPYPVDAGPADGR
ncbi:MAG: hypothetical protein K8W52_33400 [Deltaproteobacteria bacterium]|nr:hypothetical protein [Deltaproteobacteria bacterium]